MSVGGHWLIIGMTMSGKTTLAKELSKKYSAAGIQCVVLDHMRDPGWSAAHVFSDADEFLDYVRDPARCLRCALFVDESGQTLDKNDKRYRWLTTTSRHHGHRCHIIGQRAESIDRTTRSQCATLAAFNLSLPDAKQYARDFNAPELLECPTLTQGEYILKRLYSPAVRGKLF